MFRCTKQNLKNSGLNHKDIYCLRILEVVDWLQNPFGGSAIPISGRCVCGSLCHCLMATKQLLHLKPYVFTQHESIPSWKEGDGEKTAPFLVRLYLLIKGESGPRSHPADFASRFLSKKNRFFLKPVTLHPRGLLALST